MFKLSDCDGNLVKVFNTYDDAVYYGNTEGYDVNGYDGVFELPLDKYFDSLDSYLETISDNLTEGYLIPNNLMRGE